MCVADEVVFGISVIICQLRVMSSCRIWPVSSVVHRSPDHAFEIFRVIAKSVGFQIDHSREYWNFPKIGKITKFLGLEVKLELEAVSAVKLLPFFSVADPELPSPVEVFDTANFCCHLLRDLIEGQGLFHMHFRHNQSIIYH